MKNKLIIAILVFLLVIVAVLIPVSITGFAVNTGVQEEAPYDYIWTTAKCIGSECADYEVTCKNGEVLEERRVTEYISFSDSWEDPRDSFELC